MLVLNKVKALQCAYCYGNEKLGIVCGGGGNGGVVYLEDLNILVLGNKGH